MLFPGFRSLLHANGRVAVSYPAVLIIKSIAAGLKFLVMVSFAHLLSLGAFGRYGLIIATLQVLMLPALFGFGPLLVRQVVLYASGGLWPLLRGILIFSTSSATVFALAAGGMLLSAIWLFVFPGDPEAWRSFAIACLALPFMCLVRLSNAVLQGSQRPVAAACLQEMLSPVAMLALIWGLHVLAERKIGVDLAVGIFAGGFAVTALTAWVFTLRVLPGDISRIRSQFAPREWLVAALPFAVSMSVTYLNLQVDVLALGFLAGDKAVGLFTPPKQFVILLSFATTSIATVVQPRIVRLYRDKAFADLQTLVTGAARLVLVTIIPAIVILALFGDRLLGLYGPVFESAWPVLLVLLIGEAANAVCGLAAVLLNMTNRQHIPALAAGAALALNIPLCLILIPVYGVIGAAISTASVAILTSFGLATAAIRSTGINPLAINWLHRHRAAG